MPCFCPSAPVERPQHPVPDPSGDFQRPFARSLRGLGDAHSDRTRRKAGKRDRAPRDANPKPPNQGYSRGDCDESQGPQREGRTPRVEG